MPRFYSPAAATLRLLCLAVPFQALVFGLTHSTVSLTASPNPSNYGQAVTLTATVTAGATGKVTFYDGVTILGVGTISGTAATTTMTLASGARSLRAYYGGDTTYASSSSTPLPQTVVAGTSLGFHHPVTHSIGLNGTAMAVGDFDGDGRLDFAMANNNNNAVEVFLGKGDGTFHAAVSYATDSYTSSVAVGDFNGDGKMDLAVANVNTADVSILLGNGDGTFQAAVN